MESLIGRKILFVITKSNWGGAQKYVYTLATRSKEAGGDVAVALGGTGGAGAPSGLLETHLKEAGVRTIFLKSLARDVSLWHEFSAFFELLQVLQKEKPDVLHLNSSKVGALGALAGRIASVRNIIFTAHGWAHREARNPFSKLFIWILSWKTILLAHTIIAVSERDYQDSPVFFSRKKIRMIHNGISWHPDVYSKEQARIQVADIVPSLPKEIPLILTIGELTKNKAQKVLLEALSRVHSPSFCIIVGEGEERSNLEYDIKKYGLEDRVVLAGFVPNSSQLLAAADMFVLPSRKEGLPFTILEAGLAMLPVIATDTGGIKEILGTDQTTGILIPKDNVAVLAAAIENLLKNPTLREQLGGALKKQVLKNFSEGTMVETTIETYV